MNDSEVTEFRTRFGIPISDDEVANAPFYRPPADSVEAKYIAERRKAHGRPGAGRVRSAPSRSRPTSPRRSPSSTPAPRAARRRRRWCSSRMLSKLLRDESIGKLVVPIVPDEARTFGMEALFRQVGIYATPASSTSRSIATRCSTTRKPKTARSSRRASTRPARCRRSSPPAPPTPPTASTRSRSSSSTRCSASSGSAT